MLNVKIVESRRKCWLSLCRLRPPEILLNGDNKTRMMELIAEYIETHKAKVFNILRTNKILISLDNKCISISRLSTTVEESLKSNQEEADTKVILHCYQI